MSYSQTRNITVRPILFFFSSRRRHTRYWRDWSSEVCSSDLGLTYLRATDQTGPDYLGGKFAEDLQTTAGFLLEQGGITKVASPQEYQDHVDAGPAERASE